MELEMKMMQTSQNSWNDHHVLFVDDDVAVLKSLNRVLRYRRVGWKFSFAHNATAAREVMREKPVDVLVSDIKMPGQDGFALLEALRKDPAWGDLPVVLITGLEGSKLKTKALELGATDLLSKPVNTDELVARINLELRQSRKFHELRESSSRLRERVIEHSRELEAGKIEVILRLAKAAEFRLFDHDENHTVRIGYYSKCLSDRLRLEREFCDSIFVASPLHDIGKIGIPDSLLLKKGPLTQKQKNIMNYHCELGHELLGPAKLFENARYPQVGKMISIIFDFYETTENKLIDMAAEIALGHHEWFDGSGYPYGKRSYEIPLAARIVAIADVYDTLRMGRSYKPAYSHEDAIAQMRRENHKHFDPRIFSAFEACSDDFDRIHGTGSF